MAHKRIESFRYAWNGLVEGFSSQWNFRIHCICAVAVIIAGLYFNISSGEWIALSLCIGFVMSAELFNTAMEYIVNLVSPGQNILAGKVKDLAAGGVLVAAITSLVVGTIIFLPKTNLW